MAVAAKIKVANPVVDLDGDEMTRCGDDSPSAAARQHSGGVRHQSGCSQPLTVPLPACKCFVSPRRVIWQMIKDKVKREGCGWASRRAYLLPTASGAFGINLLALPPVLHSISVCCNLASANRS